MSGLILPYKDFMPEIAEDAFIAETATVIGNTVIGSESSIWYDVTIRGDVHEIRIGERTNIQDGSVVHVTEGDYGTYIGSDILIGHMCLIHGCTLEDGCFIGMKAIVMDGAVVESGAMVAAGALVTPGKRVKRGELWAGSPAKHMRDLKEEDIAGFKQATDHYCAVAREYIARQRRDLKKAGE